MTHGAAMLSISLKRYVPPIKQSELVEKIIAKMKKEKNVHLEYDWTIKTV